MSETAKRSITPWVVGILLLALCVFLFVRLQAILTPFIVAAVLAYILNPLVEKLSRYKVPRAIAAMLVMLFSLALLVLLLLIIVPMLLSQFSNLYDRLPEFIRWIHIRLVPWLNHNFRLNIEWNSEYVIKWLQQHNGSLKTTLSKWIPAIMRQGSSVVVSITNILLLPFLLYYFLLDWPRWTNGIRRMMPRRFLPLYVRVATNMDKMLGEFLRGQIMVMLIMGMVYGCGLMFVGLDSGFAIGMVAGLLVFVPYLGAFTGLLLATLAAVLQYGSWSGLIVVWSVFAVGQFLESFFITPKIVGDRIGLSPFWVIFALMAFGQLLGFVGMLLALPLAAICLVLLRECGQMYVHSRYYLKETGQPDNND